MPGAFEDRRLGTLTSVAVKAPCKAVTTTAITLNGEQTLGGVACVSGDRVLVAIAGGSVNNGIWVVDTGDWSRGRDFDGNRDVVQGTMVLVTPGDLARFWQVQSANPIVIGQTVIDIEPLDPSAIYATASQILFDFNNTYLSGSIGEALAGLKQFAVADADMIQAVITDVAAGTARVIACYGDSTMWGADPSNLANQVSIPPPTALANLVNTYHGNTALTVTNNALSGTTATQMIAGTDGSGSTFAAKMAASSASIVYCNHGVNDAYGANATTLAQYKTALLAFVYTCRLYGKTPVLVTPFPALTFGTFGSQARAEATSRFAEQMRKIAADHSVALVDNNLTLSRVLGVDGYLPLTILPDGVHASQAGYTIAGNNLARPLLEAQAETFTRPGQRLPSSASAIKATNQTFSASATSRVGVVVTTATTPTETMRMVFCVDEPGLDISFSHPIFASGCASIAVNLDGSAVGTLSQLSTNFNVSFVQDWETVIARNIPPGLHILILTTTGAGGIGLHCLRSREAAKPLLLPNGFAAPGQMSLMAQKLELTSGVANTMFVCDDIPVGGFLDSCTFEWTGQMLKDSGVIIGGNLGSNAGPAACERLVGVILNPATGFLAVIEATAPATYTTTVLGAVDLSVASHLYRFTLTTAGQLTVYVDGAAVGAPVALAGPWRGGLLGLWKNSNTGALTVTNVSRVWGL
jgi:lysophospholipase L1-like esterase